MKKLLLLSIYFLPTLANASILIEEADIIENEGEQTFHQLAQKEKRRSHLMSKSGPMRQAENKHLFKKSKHKELSWAMEYTKAKNAFTNATGISYTIDASYLMQRGAPNGKRTPIQSQYYGTLTWDMFQSNRFGSGSLNLAYTLNRYWNKNATILGNNIGVATPVNDYTSKANYFDELSYTHTLGGKMDWLSLTVGQFPLYNFDGTQYDSNQQINFINEALSQNLTSLYPTSGLGGYISVTPNNLISFSAGIQDATNVSGNRITFRDFKDKKYLPFMSASLTPKTKWGDLTLSLLLYHQPSVPEQIGKADGWSFNIQQNIGEKWAVFGRINGVSKGINGFNQSYVIGSVYNNPLNRNELDQIGVAYALNKINKNVMGENKKPIENVIEAYWAWGISSFVTITPDIQFYINPSLNEKSNTATVASLRATFMF